MSEKDILKEFGDVLLDAGYIVDNPPPVISVTPKIDIALGGWCSRRLSVYYDRSRKDWKDSPCPSVL